MNANNQAYQLALTHALDILCTTDRPLAEEMHDLVEEEYLLTMFPGLGTYDNAGVCAQHALSIVQAERVQAAAAVVAPAQTTAENVPVRETAPAAEAVPETIAPVTPLASVAPVATKEGFRALAERAAARGQRPLPIVVGAKKPCIAWLGTVIDTASKAEWPGLAQEWIDACDKQFPTAACCVVAKPDEFLFIDEDESERFRKGYEEYSGEPFPRTFTTESRPDHRQSHWLQSDMTRNKIGNVSQASLGFLSIRQNNLYVLSEGSPHPEGGAYRIVDNTPAIPMPDKLVEHILNLKSLRADEKAGKKKQTDSSADKPEPGRQSVLADTKSVTVSEKVDTSVRGALIPNGEHDSTLFAIACRFRRQGLEREEIETRLIDICEARCVGYGSDYREMCANKAESACKYPVGTGVIVNGKMVLEPSGSGESEPEPEPSTFQETVNRLLAEDKTTEEICELSGFNKLVHETLKKVAAESSSSILRIRRGDQIKTRRIEWLWPNRIPLGKLTILTGNPDQGKSLVTMYIAAQLTTGRRLFACSEGLPACDVLIFAGEDEADDTVKPRLQAAGADPLRYHVAESITVVDGKGKTTEEREAQLDTDIRQIEAVLESNPGIRLIIIDPLSNYLGQANMNREQEVRRVLVPLKNLAARRGVAIVAVMHLNKNSDASAIHRIGGAMAFAGVARAVWVFLDEPDKEDGGDTATGIAGDKRTTGRHCMLRIKGNIARAVGGLAYAIKTTRVMVGGEPTDQPYIEWLGETQATADEVFAAHAGRKSSQPGRPSDQKQDAKAWLTEFLTLNGSESAANVETFGSKAGHTLRTLQRVKAEIGVTAQQEGRKWYWVLPGRKLETGKEVINLD